jgi:hypothetical protein
MSKNISEMKNAYENYNVPIEALDRVKAGIAQAENEEGKNKIYFYCKRTAAVAAAAVLAVVILANSNETVANAMEKVPVLGAITRVVTFRTYSDRTGSFEAEVEVPEISENQPDENAINESLPVINRTIDEYADELIEMYEAELKESEGQGNYELVSSYEVIRDDEKYLSIRINSTVVMASGAQFVKIYNVDKTTGEIVTLSDLFGSDSNYIDTISEEIKRQMQEQMAQDENKIYFIKSEDEPSGFDKITDETNFYINENGGVVIVFDEYEVAPGYMGVVEFNVS